MLSAARLDLDVHTPMAVGGMPEVDEDQNTFAGNALKKARALAALLPEEGWALADDSGLCVDALLGAPGVRSARFAGPGASDRDNLNKLLAKLEPVEDENRGAAFECHLALVSPHGEERLFVGRCPGRIVREPAGKKGFGYDPVFVPEGHERTFAEMTGEEKAGLSHRGQAFARFVEWVSARV